LLIENVIDPGQLAFTGHWIPRFYKSINKIEGEPIAFDDYKPFSLR
jgi:hypothetical protein